MDVHVRVSALGAGSKTLKGYDVERKTRPGVKHRLQTQAGKAECTQNYDDLNESLLRLSADTYAERVNVFIRWLNSPPKTSMCLYFRAEGI